MFYELTQLSIQWSKPTTKVYQTSNKRKQITKIDTNLTFSVEYAHLEKKIQCNFSNILIK